MEARDVPTLGKANHGLTNAQARYKTGNRLLAEVAGEGQTPTDTTA